MERGRRKVRIGRVVSDKMDKTIVVAVEEFVLPLLPLFVVTKITPNEALAP